MIETKRFHCRECGYYWETTGGDSYSGKCPACKSAKIYRATGQKRYSRKSRPKVRGSYSQTMRR